MTQRIRQSTAVKVVVGPFVDATDGFTPETGVDLSVADEAEIVKHDSGSPVSISSVVLTHLGSGFYNLPLTTSHTDTCGLISINIADTSVCRPVRTAFEVIPAEVYDALIAGSDKLQADVVQVSGSTAAADNLEEAAKTIVTGTVQTSSTTTVVNTNLTEATNDHYNGRSIVFVTGALAGQAAVIEDYNGSTKAITVSGALTEAPGSGDTFVIV